VIYPVVVKVLDFGAMWICKLMLTFQRNMLSPSSGAGVTSQSHVTADGQSASLSWCRAPSGTHDQIFSIP
jgi:hypothetical protein